MDSLLSLGATVEAGKYADIIAVQCNPLNDISVMQKIAFAMKRGVVFKKQLQTTRCAMCST